MITYIRRGLVAAVATLSIVAIGAPSVGAQASGGSANGFRISPVRSELTIEKGKSQSITVTVENPTSVAMTARAVVNDFVASADETGTPRLILDAGTVLPKNDFKSLVAAIPDMQLLPNQKKDISVSISVPKGASSGGYYGAVRFIPADGSNKQGNVGLTASVGTIVLVTVLGNLTEKLSLVQISAEQKNKAKSFITSGDVSVLTRLKNDGDIHVQPFGRVQVKNMFGKVVEDYEFNNVEPRANILPDSTRRFDDALKNKKWFGRYTIQANLGYAQGTGNLITTNAAFWYVPTWALYALLVLVLVIAIGGYLAVRYFRGDRGRRH
jgi:hypothetical protein